MGINLFAAFLAVSCQAFYFWNECAFVAVLLILSVFLLNILKFHCSKQASCHTMDVADANVGQLRVKDDVGVRCQKLFQDFLEE